VKDRDAEGEPQRRERIRDFWDEYAQRDPLIAIYDNAEVRANRDEPFWRSGEADARRLAWFFAPGARVVEIGCGIGRMMRFLAPRCGEIVGVDISANMIAQGREALAGAPNVRWLQTNGASLAGLDDASVDFLYSLLVLIHVDRRSAFRYLEEIRRVLPPRGLAFLQFQNIACPEGIASMRGVLDSDYPLEFYTDEELRYLFAEVGLSVVAHFSDAQFLFYTLTPGDAAERRERIARGLAVVEAESGATGDLDVALRSTLDEVQPLRLELVVARDGRQVRVEEAYVDAAPGASRLVVRRAGADQPAEASWNGRALALREVEFPGVSADAPQGPAAFQVSLLPSGVLPATPDAAAYPGLAHAWRS